MQTIPPVLYRPEAWSLTHYLCILQKTAYREIWADGIRGLMFLHVAVRFTNELSSGHHVL